MLSELPQLGHVRLDEDAAVEEPAPRVQLPPVASQRADQPHCLRPVITRNMIYKQHRENSTSLVAKNFQKCD